MESYSECRVFFAELWPALTLAIVNSTNKAEPDEENRVARVQGYLRSRKSLAPYFSFFVAKEHTHLSMLSYVHQFPGLVHFILVDRTSHRLIAPSINALYGQKFQLISPELQSLHQDLIKGHVWRLCSMAQQFLAQGHSQLLLRQSDFLYHFDLWFEDLDGTRLSHDGIKGYQVLLCIILIFSLIALRIFLWTLITMQLWRQKLFLIARMFAVSSSTVFICHLCLPPLSSDTTSFCFRHSESSFPYISLP